MKKSHVRITSSSVADGLIDPLVRLTLDGNGPEWKILKGLTGLISSDKLCKKGKKPDVDRMGNPIVGAWYVGLSEDAFQETLDGLTEVLMETDHEIGGDSIDFLIETVDQLTSRNSFPCLLTIGAVEVAEDETI